MELLKKQVQMLCETGNITDQITLEEDCIVPDSLPDAGKIVWKKAVIQMDEIQVEDAGVHLLGQLQVQILYLDEEEPHRLHKMETSIPFQKNQALDASASKENTQMSWKLEDLTISAINSRKLGIRALLAFWFTVEDHQIMQTVVELHGISDAAVQMEELELLELKSRKKDIFRIKDSLTLPSGKPAIQKLIWKQLQLRGTQVRVLDKKLEIQGELFVCILYEGEEQSEVQCLESVLPFHGELDYPDAQADQIFRIEIKMGHYSVEAVDDFDGEKRQLAVEAVLDLNIRLYEEERVEMIKDVYSPVKELLPIREACSYESLLMKNCFRVRAKGTLKLTSNQPRMLQICGSMGEGSIDEVRKSEKGLTAEGAVSVSVLYRSSDDKIPYAVLEGAIPFQQFLELPNLDENCRHHVQSHVEQLTVSMLDSETVEVKAVLSVELFAVRVHHKECMTDVEVRELDKKKLEELPGLVGYLVQPEDTLWSIAKRYFTTPEKICELNHVKEGEIRPGMGLVIVKTVRTNDGND